MQKLILPVLSLAILLSPATALANSYSVVNNISATANSSNGGSAQSSVNVTNTTGTNSNNFSYSSSGQNVHAEVVNGVAKITIDGKEITSPTMPPTPTLPPMPTPRPTTNPQVVKDFQNSIASTQAQIASVAATASEATTPAAMQEVIDHQMGLLEFLTNQIKSFINLLTS